MNFTKIEDIPGWIKPSQISLIESIAKNLPKNSKVLEIGCGYGRSTWAWLDVLDESCSLDIVDSWQLDVNRLPTLTENQEAIEFGKKHGQKKLFEEIISAHPKVNLLKNLYNESSKSLIKKKLLDKNYDVVYIDGDHSYNVLYSELTYFSNVKILCGDDYNFRQFKSVIRAVNNFLYHYGINYDDISKDRLLEVDRRSFFWKITFRG